MKCKDCAYRQRGICTNKKSDNFKDYVSPLLICKHASNQIDVDDIINKCFCDSHLLKKDECKLCEFMDCPQSKG